MPGPAPSLSDRFVANFENAFPGWRSIELFGPPGAGKTYISRLIAKDIGLYNCVDMTDGQIVALCNPTRARMIGFVPFSRVRRKLLKKNIKRNIQLIRLRTEEYDYSRLMEILNGTDIIHGVGDNRAYAMLICRAYVINECLERATLARVLFDEGIVRSLMGVLARIANDAERDRVAVPFRKLLELYPGEKNAALITTDPKECLRRQQQRGAVLVSPEVPQERFHEVAEKMRQLCQETGWNVAVFRNDTVPVVDMRVT